jgi:hypothetical protein
LDWLKKKLDLSVDQKRRLIDPGHPEEELEQRICEYLREYYHYLDWQLTKRRGRDFWSFHHGRLAALGYPLSRARLVAYAMSYDLDLVLNPKRTAESGVLAL